MNNIKILDCTLRDGGYINKFEFGFDVIKEMINKLSMAKIDIIECGFLQSGNYDKNYTLFDKVSRIRNVIGVKKENLMYVAMIQCGNFSIDEVEKCDNTSIDGIRVTFHENEIEEAFLLGEKLKEKGYSIFMQPVGTTTISDDVILKMISKVNRLKPYAFYMVDTLGVMYKQDLLRMYYLIDHNLESEICVGFHSHNNLQLSFSNAQELMQINTDRIIIIDTSVNGMGRGAGNLCTELVTQFLNDNYKYNYDNIQVLEIVDEHIAPLLLKYSWGYAVPYYLAAVAKCHPNYVSYLLNHQTLHVKDISIILNSIDIEKRSIYDKNYINNLYLSYMSDCVDDLDTLNMIKKDIKNKKVLILAPGYSIKEYKDKIIKIIKKDNPYVIAINFIPEEIPINLLFISNKKRLKENQELEMLCEKGINLIVTSNVKVEKCVHSILNYSDYLNGDMVIADNAGLMCINMLKKINVMNIELAGFDGFSNRNSNNFYPNSMNINVEQERLDKINVAFIKRIQQLRCQMNINFITDTLYK